MSQPIEIPEPRSPGLLAARRFAAGDDLRADVSEVVRLILEHARSHPDESLGVIALGVRHGERIAQALRTALAAASVAPAVPPPPAGSAGVTALAAVTATRDAARELAEFFAAPGATQAGAEPFFVKNLEQVRDDERDAIIISVGYGSHPAARTRYQWGPPRHGQRGRNVAAARARYRFTVVSCAVNPDDTGPGVPARPAGLAITVGPRRGRSPMILALDDGRPRW
jgi:hypothetical protein